MSLCQNKFYYKDIVALYVYMKDEAVSYLGLYVWDGINFSNNLVLSFH